MKRKYLIISATSLFLVVAIVLIISLFVNKKVSKNTVEIKSFDGKTIYVVDDGTELTGYKYITYPLDHNYYFGGENYNQILTNLKQQSRVIEKDNNSGYLLKDGYLFDYKIEENMVVICESVLWDKYTDEMDSCFTALDGYIHILDNSKTIDISYEKLIELYQGFNTDYVVTNSDNITFRLFNRSNNKNTEFTNHYMIVTKLDENTCSYTIVENK